MTRWTNCNQETFEVVADALDRILQHVEEDSFLRIGNQCTLCYTFRTMGHAALARAQQPLQVSEADCLDCQAAKRHAYSDATTPGFFYAQCDKHRAQQPPTEQS